MKKMKLIILSVLSIANVATATTTQDIFYAKVISYGCEDARRIANLKSTCLITVNSIEDDSEETVGIVIHSDLYFDGGKYIQEGSVVSVDLTYTQDRTAYLRSYFPKSTAKIFFHDDNTSYGSYSDVIKHVRRD